MCTHDKNFDGVPDEPPHQPDRQLDHERVFGARKSVGEVNVVNLSNKVLLHYTILMMVRMKNKRHRAWYRTFSRGRSLRSFWRKCTETSV